MWKLMQLFMFYVKSLFLEINPLVDRYARETLPNIEKPYSNLFKTYSTNHSTGVIVPFLLL